jgi:uncharacterized surface protein with fasciclin (FAS1) repeats
VSISEGKERTHAHTKGDRPGGRRGIRPAAGRLPGHRASQREAGLARKLNAATGITVFAPTDAAYHKVPANWNAATAGYLVVPETLTPATLAGTHRTLEGSDPTVIGHGHDFLINSTAKVVCGNVRTANATVYFIDTVLTP